MPTSSKESILKKYQLNPTKIPKHIAVIMDGNGRWAKQHNLSRMDGHKAGRKTLKATLINCANLGVKHLTTYAFSTENWRRPKAEVSFLMRFFGSAINEELKELHEKQVKWKFLGDIQSLQPTIREKISAAEALTQHNSGIQFNIMMNYGSRFEIVQAAQKLIDAPPKKPITEADFQSAMYTSDIPDPDILIRTGGDYRISNYMLWQIAYSELFFLDMFWPDFDMATLADVVHQFQGRERRFGGLKTK